jgi:Tetratricopeptide repeat
MNDEELQALFRQARDAADPPAGVRERVLGKLVLPPTPSTPPPGGGGAAPIGVKLVIGAVVAGAALIMGAGALHGFRDRAPAREPASTPVAATVSAAAPSAEPVAPQEEGLEIVPNPVETAPRAAPPVAARSAAPSASADSLAEEIKLLRAAETALRGGDPARALVLLDQHAQRFPRGALSQERTVTQIQALCASGRGAQARAMFQRLRAAAPNSPHLASLQKTCPALGD